MTDQGGRGEGGGGEGGGSGDGDGRGGGGGGGGGVASGEVAVRGSSVGVGVGLSVGGGVVGGSADCCGSGAGGGAAERMPSRMGFDWAEMMLLLHEHDRLHTSIPPQGDAPHDDGSTMVGRCIVEHFGVGAVSRAGE